MNSDGQTRRAAEKMFRVAENDVPVEVGTVYRMGDGRYPVMLVVTRVDTGMKGVVNVVPFHWHSEAVLDTDLFLPSRLAGADLIVMLDEGFSIPESRLGCAYGYMPEKALDLILDTLSFRVSWTPRDDEAKRIEDIVYGAVYAIQKEVAEVVYKEDTL